MLLKELSQRVKQPKNAIYLKSDGKPEMLQVIYDFFDDKIVDLYLKNKIQSRKPKLIKVNR